MIVIRKLAERVEKEHNQFLRDSQRLEDRSGTAGVNGGQTPAASFAGNVDFASLVGGKAGNGSAAPGGTGEGSNWDDDVWGSIFNDDVGLPS